MSSDGSSASTTSTQRRSPWASPELVIPQRAIRAVPTASWLAVGWLVVAWLLAGWLLACEGRDGGPETASSGSEGTARAPGAAEPTDTADPFGGLSVRWIGSPEGDGPVVVLMHGYGATGDDLVPLARALAATPSEGDRGLAAGTRFLLPAAPLELGGGARAWWPLDIDRLRRRFSKGGPDEGELDVEPDGLAQARDQVRALLDDLRDRLGVPPSRTVVGGFSQGAMLATDAVVHGEDDLAGLVILSGGVVARRRWAASMPARRAVPVFLSHGRRDPLIPFATAARLSQMLHTAGYEVDEMSFDGGHEIPPDVRRRLAVFVARTISAR